MINLDAMASMFSMVQNANFMHINILYCIVSSSKHSLIYGLWSGENKKKDWKNRIVMELNFRV